MRLFVCMVLSFSNIFTQSYECKCLNVVDLTSKISKVSKEEAPFNINYDFSSVDNTQFLQNAINKLGYNGVLDGKNKAYMVTSLFLKSNITLKNFILTTKSGSKDFVSPITISGLTSTMKNINLININVNGNRQNQNNILSTSEDGGRCGFRIIGDVENLKIIDCQANYCGADGLMLYSSNAATNMDYNFTFKKITINNFKAFYNRRHGISMDCANGVYISNVTLKDNGKDLNFYSPQSNGNRGARFNNKLYGNGIDIEGYGIGTAISNIHIDNLIAIKNVGAGLVIYDPTDPKRGNFIERKNIFITNSTIDMGYNLSGDCSALVISSAVNVSPNEFSYGNVRISNTKIYGRLMLRGVENAKIDFDSHLNYSDYVSQTIDCQNITIRSKLSGLARKNYSNNNHLIDFIAK